MTSTKMYTEHECSECGTEFESDEPVSKAKHDAFVCTECAPDYPRRQPEMPEGQRMAEAREERRRLMS